MAESPDPGALREQLARWAAAGLIDPDQADRIEATERERAVALPGRRLPLVAEVLGYVGAVIAITAIVVTVHQIWKHVPTAAEMATAGVIAVGLLLVGAALRTDTDPALARLRSALWLLSMACAAAFVAVLTGRYLQLADADGALMTAAASLVYAVPLWWRNRSGLQHLAAFGAAVAVFETGIDRIDPRAGALPFGIALWVFALAWGIAVSRGRLVPAPIGMLLSGAGALAGAIIAMGHAAGVLLAMTTVAGLFACGVLMHQVPLIGIGAVGTLYVVPDVVTRYLPGSVAAPLAVAVVGMVLLGIALWLARQRKEEPFGHAAARTLRLQPEHTVESPVDLAHQRCRQVADRCLQVGLVEGHQGRDVNHRVFGQARGRQGQEHVAGHRGQGRVRSDDGGDGGVQPAVVKIVGLDDQDGTWFRGLTATRFAKVGPADAAAAGHQSSWPAR